MTVHSPKQTRAVQLFRDGHSCRYVSRILGIHYKKMVRFRRGLDLPDYDMTADPSVARLRRWSGLLLRPKGRDVKTWGNKMAAEFHVNRCRFPLWPHGDYPTGEFCNERTMQTSSYCIRHHAVCYVAGTENVFPSQWGWRFGSVKRKPLARRG